MLTATPGGNEPGVLGFAIADALIDLLIQKGTITQTDARTMLVAVADKLSKNGTMFGQRCSKIITDGLAG